MAIRLVGIAKEPFWLDEILAHDHSSGTVAETLEAVSRNVHPPLYYFGLKGWRTVLGSSVAAMRGYSTLWSILGIVFLTALARDIGGRWTAGLIAALLAAVNPLDVFFAQEARMYAQAAALGALTSWLLLRWMRATVHATSHRQSACWAACYWLAAAALVLSHYLTLTIVIAQGLFAVVHFVRLRQWRNVAGYFGGVAAWIAALLPWLAFVRRAHGLQLSMVSWVPAPSVAEPLLLVTRDLIWGRSHFSLVEWHAATAISVLVLVAAAGALLAALRRPVEHAGRPSPTTLRSVDLVYGLWLVAGPITEVMVASLLFQPAFYRPRFCLLVLPPFLVLLAVAIDRGRPRAVRWGLLATALVTMGFATVSQYRGAEKTGLAQFASLWRAHGPPDYVLFYPRWNRRVAGFYLQQPVLNVPTRVELETALRRGTPRRVWICRLAGYDMKAEPEAERALHDWVLSLGPHRLLARVDDVEVVEVLAQPLPVAYPPYVPGSRVSFGDPEADPYLWDGWYQAEKAFRWSRGTRAAFLFALAQPAASELTLEMFCFSRQRVTLTLNGHPLASFLCSERAPHVRRFSIPPGVARRDNALLFDLPDAVSPKQVGESDDTRRLALGVGWLEVR